MKKFISTLLISVLALLMAYLLIVRFVWEINNPKANSMTFFTHFYEVITFKKSQDFQ